MGLVDSTSLFSMYEDKDILHFPSNSNGWFTVAEGTYNNMMIESFDITNKLLISTEDWMNDNVAILAQLEEILLEHPDVLDRL